MMSEAQRQAWNDAVLAVDTDPSQANRDRLEALKAELLNAVYEPHVGELMAQQAGELTVPVLPPPGLNDLARQVQRHVRHQPWGQSGNEPVPVEVWFDAGDLGNSPTWRVRFVTGVQGDPERGKRTWGRASGPTIEAALRAARTIQGV